VNGADELLVDLALRGLPARSELVLVGGPPVLPPSLASRRVTRIPAEEALSFLHARAASPVAAIAAAFPSRHAPLLPLLAALRGALAPDGRALLVDLVWQTAPTPELLRAFAPPPGREKVRPIEGYEMQMEHSGLRVEERLDVERARWSAGLVEEQRAAVAADERGAARVVAWVVSAAPDEDGGEA